MRPKIFFLLLFIISIFCLAGWYNSHTIYQQYHESVHVQIAFHDGCLNSTIDIRGLFDASAYCLDPEYEQSDIARSQNVENDIMGYTNFAWITIIWTVINIFFFLVITIKAFGDYK